MVFILSVISATYSWDILQFNITKSLNWSWKNSDYLTGLGLTWSYTGLGPEKYSNCLNAVGLILSYIGLGLEKWSKYLTGVRLILRYIWLGLPKKRLDYLIGFGLILPYIEFEWIKWINQAEMQLEKCEDFLEFKQFAMQSSPVSLGHVLCGVWKIKYLCC